MKAAGLVAWVLLSVTVAQAQAASRPQGDAAASAATRPAPGATVPSPETTGVNPSDRRTPPQVSIDIDDNQEINPSERDAVQSPIVAWLGVDWALYLLGALIILLQAVVIFLVFSQRRRLAMVGSPQTLIEAFADGQHADVIAHQRAGYITQTQALSRASATTLVDALVALYRQVEDLRAEVGQLKGGASVAAAHPGAFQEEGRRRQAFVDAAPRTEPRAFGDPVIQPRRAREHDVAPDIFASDASSHHAGALQALMPHYAVAVRSRKSLVRFAEERGARYVADGRLVEDASSAMLIALPLAGDDFAIVPGPELASNFSSMYDAERSMPEDARRAFHFRADGSRNPKLERAGLGHFSDGLLVVSEKGVLGGLRD